jgi:ergothioneine biosynthesis protein EgtB
MSKNINLPEQYESVRAHSLTICSPLATEDYVVQPIVDVSPPKWHLGHTTWFFETFVLKPFFKGYTEFDSQYNFVFNSYYETVGARVIRTDRGNLSRPSVSDVYAYRAYVDENMKTFLRDAVVDKTLSDTIILGLNHEQQHQELLFTDIKYILGHNPLFPEFKIGEYFPKADGKSSTGFHSIQGGVYEIGFHGQGFSFDNEHGRHKVYLNPYSISEALVSNGEYLEFINDKGYEDFRHWHAEGWDWVNKNKIKSPLYWHLIDGAWMNYTFDGLKPINTDNAVCHVSFYEASAYASWKGKRLPTEAEWEVASGNFHWGQRWEWTGSAYLPFPGFKKAAGAIGEYNGKFMVNQMVLRGASVATPTGHSRNTYRNFFHALHQWQFTGIRLAE